MPPDIALSLVSGQLVWADARNDTARRIGRHEHCDVKRDRQCCGCRTLTHWSPPWRRLFTRLSVLIDCHPAYLTRTGGVAQLSEIQALSEACSSCCGDAGQCGRRCGEPGAPRVTFHRQQLVTDFVVLMCFAWRCSPCLHCLFRWRRTLDRR
jgi:hypothetical protein